MFELAQEAGRMFGPRIVEYGGRHHEMWIGPLAALLFLALLVGGAIVIVRMLINRPPSGGASRGPLAILEERFARGEIDEEEFRTRRDALRS
jgi:putative membrane protein